MNCMNKSCNCLIDELSRRVHTFNMDSRQLFYAEYAISMITDDIQTIAILR